MMRDYAGSAEKSQVRMDRGSLAGSVSLILSSQERFSEKCQTVADCALCIPGTFSLSITGVHLINKVAFARPSHFLSFFTFGLMAVIVLGGTGGRYGRKIKMVREYWGILHIPLTAMFYVTLGIHVLIKTGIL